VYLKLHVDYLKYFLPELYDNIAVSMVKSGDPVQSIGSYGMELESGHLYGVLTYRGELASWNWAFFIPNPTVSPIGSAGTLFHVVNANDAVEQWKFEIETKDIVNSPHIVAIIRLVQLSQFQDSKYEDIVGDSEGSLRSMFQMVPIPTMDSSVSRAEFSSRTWFLDAVNMLDDCGVVACDDVWPLEREIRRLGFTAMDNYLENKGMWRSLYLMS
jgi:hypothetical protein